jgi:hypothetical protein
MPSRFCDDGQCLERLGRRNLPQHELAGIVGLQMSRPKLPGACEKIRGEQKSAAGRKPLDCVCLLKHLILARMHHLLDPHTEIHIQDWGSLRRFLGISAEENVPELTWCIPFGAKTAKQWPLRMAGVPFIQWKFE